MMVALPTTGRTVARGNAVKQKSRCPRFEKRKRSITTLDLPVYIGARCEANPQAAAGMLQVKTTSKFACNEQKS